MIYRIYLVGGVEFEADIPDVDLIAKVSNDDDFYKLTDTNGYTRFIRFKHITQIVEQKNKTWSGVVTPPSPKQLKDEKTREELKESNDPESYIRKSKNDLSGL